MRIYQGGELEGVSIVDHGLTLTVNEGKATVEYNGAVGDFYDSLRTGQIEGRIDTVPLGAEQLTWLEDSKTWVQRQLEDDE